MSDLPRLPHPSAFDQPAWRYTQAWAEAELGKAREELESQALDSKPESTIRLRARIKALKELTAIPTLAREAHS